MKKKRYSTTDVRDRKNWQRTLNTFSEQYNYISMTEKKDQAFRFYFTDKLSQNISEHIIFDKELSSRDLTDTKKLLAANAQMFEHKKYQPYIVKIIMGLQSSIKFNGKIIEANQFFNKSKEAILNHLHVKLEELSGKELTEQFIKKMYTTLKNKTLFPSLYISDSISSKAYRVKHGKSISNIINEHYKYYQEYSWIIHSKSDFEYYFDQSEEEPDNIIAQQWRTFIFFALKDNIEKKLYNSIEFLAEHIEPFCTKPLDEQEFQFYNQENLQIFISDKNNLQGIKLKKFIEAKEKIICFNYRQRGQIHQYINILLPLSEQLEILNSHVGIREYLYDLPDLIRFHEYEKEKDY